MHPTLCSSILSLFLPIEEYKLTLILGYPKDIYKSIEASFHHFNDRHRAYSVFNLGSNLWPICVLVQSTLQRSAGKFKSAGSIIPLYSGLSIFNLTFFNFAT